MFRRNLRRLIPALIVVVALITSGCFQIRGLRITPDQIAIGEKATVRLDMYQLSASQVNSDGYAFVLVGFNETDLKLKTVSQFDLWGNYGGPFGRTNDTALRDSLLTPGSCTFNGIDASEITGLKWWAYRTTDKMDSTAGLVADSFRVKLAFERLGGDSDEAGEFVVFSGTWSDIAANGIPEAGESGCFSMVGSSIRFFEL